LHQHYGSTHGKVYQSVSMEREFSVAQIARRHFLLIGFCETPRAETGLSLRLRGGSTSTARADIQKTQYPLKCTSGVRQPLT